MMARYRRQPVRHIHFARDELPFDRWEASDETTRAAIVAGEHGGIAVVYVAAPIDNRSIQLSVDSLLWHNPAYRAASFPIRNALLPVTLYTLHTRLIYARHSSHPCDVCFTCG